jgi:hypothetical protein
MPRNFETLSMMDFRSRPGEILDRVSERGESFIIERNGQRKACLVPLSVFLPDIAPERIAAELVALSEADESAKPAITEDHQLVLRFHHTLGDGETVPFEIVLPHRYPSACPKVYADLANKKVPHRWADGSLCIFGVMTAWNPGQHNIKSVVDLTRSWLESYQVWKKTSAWPTRGLSS